MRYLFFVAWNLIAILGGVCSVVACYLYVLDGSYLGVVWTGTCTIINIYCACSFLDSMRSRDAVYGKIQLLLWWRDSEWRMRWFTAGLATRGAFAVLYMIGYAGVRLAYHVGTRRGWQAAQGLMAQDLRAWTADLRTRELARAERESKEEYEHILGLMNLHQEMIAKELSADALRQIEERVKEELTKRRAES